MTEFRRRFTHGLLGQPLFKNRFRIRVVPETLLAELNPDGSEEKTRRQSIEGDATSVQQPPFDG